MAPTMAAESSRGASHLPALDLLRGLAIIGVIWHHFGGDGFPSGWWFGSSPWQAPFASWASNGWLGVNLFFVLSGAVLYFPYATRQRCLANAQDLRAFYAKRARRLLPLYYFSIAVVCGIQALPDGLALLALSTVTFNFSKDLFLPEVNWVLWSLGIEIWFSIVFPAVVASVNRFGMARVGVIVLLLSLAVRTAGVLVPGAAYADNPFLNPVKDSLPGRLDDFFAGMVVAQLLAQRFSFKRPWIALAAGLVLCTLSALCWDAIVVGKVGVYGAVVVNNIFQLGAAALILSLARLPSLRAYPIELAGMACYSIYIWHGVLMRHITPYPHSGGKLRYFALLIVLSWLSYRYIEFGRTSDVRKLLPRRRA